MQSDLWILTYDDLLEIRHLYNKNMIFTYSLTYFAHHVKKGSELLIAPPIELCFPTSRILHTDYLNFLPLKLDLAKVQYVPKNYADRLWLACHSLHGHNHSMFLCG